MEKYILIRRIGSGSYGVAYLGRERASGVLCIGVLGYAHRNCMY